MADIAHAYNMNKSTIRMISKNKDKVMECEKCCANVMDERRQLDKQVNFVELANFWTCEPAHSKTGLLGTYCIPLIALVAYNKPFC